MTKPKTNVVVVGGGPGGLAAAITAAEGGARVILFEKSRSIGGIFYLGYQLFAVESSLQQQNNIPLTKDEAFKIYMECTHWQADARLVRAFIDKSASTIDWLRSMGFEFSLLPHYAFPESQLCAHNFIQPDTFAARLKLIKDKAESLGVEIRLATAVTGLIKHDDRVVGVTAKDRSGETSQVDASAVVIASGGYPNNKEMLKKHGGFELGHDLLYFAPLKQTGDGIQMAWEAGAATDGMGVQLRYDPPRRGGIFNKRGANLMLITQQPYLWVNQQGLRFFDEGISGCAAYTANALARQKNRCAYMIFDGNTKKYMETGILDHLHLNFDGITNVPDIDGLIAEFLASGDKKDIFVADSIAALSRDMGLDPDVLQRTIDEYNNLCAKGHDDLFAKNPKYLRPVKQPKFYAFKIVNMAYGTVGGIKINEKTEVINVDHEVIHGLYAVGDCANGALSYDFSLAYRLRGNPASFAWNTGRIAAENILKQLG